MRKATGISDTIHARNQVASVAPKVVSRSLQGNWILNPSAAQRLKRFVWASSTPVLAPRLSLRDSVRVPSIGELLRLYRVRDWVHMLPLPLAMFDFHGPPVVTLVAAGRGIASAFFILAYGFFLNSVCDRQMDFDARKNPLILADAGAYHLPLALLLIANLVLAALSPWPARLATLFCLVWGCLYSMGPRLKSIPITGSLANAVGFASLLFVGMRSPALPPRFGCIVLAFAALLLQNQLIHEAADNGEDRAGGVRTTWLLLGPRWTALLVAVAGLGATAAAAGVMSHSRYTPLLVVTGAAFGVAFPLRLASPGLESNQAARLRVAHRWCAVVFGAGLFTAWRWVN
jgi:4-hydroxybenzoate polyprenyltransferase